ncbi:hypothetical protein FP2506_16104 [Fulvimarina pelagi HTCC2506]|uniref:DUF2218 domain-containing protein n=1 Tax=Fulvimarina pelagi HTCC2506 TaxID=314231 RepID=Q0G359_9HYPH|nr:DUF2218 domain-containing protein [Fulvimarina pelagi]EAU41972.1 hypothetical protein FP2506_16104 [Fulvimarina pelagi HTCC2506]
MPASSTTFQTENATRYKQAMAKHFGHKIPVEETESAAVLGFEIGSGTIAITGDGLALTASSASADDLATIEDVLERHLERFAFREEFPKLHWQRAEAGEEG